MDIDATLIGQAITFTLLVLFTMKFVWPPLNRMLDERSKQISDGLLAAHRNQQLLAETQAAISAELQKAHAKAMEIISLAEKRSAQLIDDARARADDEVHRITTDAHQLIAYEVTQAKEQLRTQLATLVRVGVERVLRKEIDTSTHASIIEEVSNLL